MRPVDLFLSHVEAQPGRTALQTSRDTMSYAELGALARSMTRELQARGVGCGDRVCSLLPRDELAVAALIATALIGACWVPLDARDSLERLGSMCQGARPRVVLVDDERATVARALDLPFICAEQVPRAAAPLPLRSIDAGLPAYLLFTSGSTGRPKGVVVSQRALKNTLDALRERPGFAPGESLLSVSSAVFDVALAEWWLPLVAGGTLILADDAQYQDPRLLADLVAAHQPSVVHATPTMWRAMLRSRGALCGRRRPLGTRAWCAGEALHTDLVDALLESTSEVWNLYGPTEASIFATIARCERGARVSLGRPVAGTGIRVLDEHQEPVLPGAAGELWLDGAGLADAYLGASRTTAAAFMPLPDPRTPGARSYATGDRVELGSDGELYYLGRIDNQVKVRGRRIELEEVEQVLRGIDGVVDSSAAVADEGDALLAWVTLDEPRSPRELESIAANSLPHGLVPRVQVVDQMPRTRTGKIDREGLRTARGERRSHPPKQAGIAALWCDVLRVEDASPELDFFDSGGHSMLAIELLARVEEETGIRVPAAEFLREPTFRALLRRVEAG